MNAKDMPLIKILRILIRSAEPIYQELARGLILAYTPGILNEGKHRLTLSRRGIHPSEQEIEIVRRDLLLAMQGENRFTEQLFTELYLEGARKRRKKDSIFYHVIFWEEFRQRPIL